MKRVWCLYRVSTKKQTDDKNDIPRQRRKCHDFIEKKSGWMLTNEVYEKGVSGYKKSSADRDVIQQVKQAASKNEFDVLLVFMFDRLGRRDNDTPIIVEWFIDNGIEVWSAEEGQQKIETHADKLITHIRFWQAEGESIKLSQRVSNAHEQMARDGEFRGGMAPYGFSLVYSGVIDKKGRAIKKRIVNSEEAAVLEYMYDLAADFGYGRNTISRMLNEKGIPSRKGEKWIPSTVAYILQNPANKGFPAYGKTSQKKGSKKIIKEADWILPNKKIDELVIVSEEKWARAQRARTTRKNKITGHDDLRTVSPGPLLFTGIIFCGHCGGTLTTFYNYKYNENKSIKFVYPKYRCTGHVGRKRFCDGQTIYSGKNIDEAVMRQVYVYLNSLLECEVHESKKNVEAKRYQYQQLLLEHKKKVKRCDEEYNGLLQEIAKCLIGNSVFNREVLSGIIDEKKEELDTLKEQQIDFEVQITNVKDTAIEKKSIKEIVRTWGTEFLKIEPDRKKCILRKLISRIDVYRDRIEIDFNTTMDDFLLEAEVYMREQKCLKSNKFVN
ncbi:MAG: recombinase family protein [Eubacterium sp.]